MRLYFTDSAFVVEKSRMDEPSAAGVKRSPQSDSNDHPEKRAKTEPDIDYESKSLETRVVWSTVPSNIRDHLSKMFASDLTWRMESPLVDWQDRVKSVLDSILAKGRFAYWNANANIQRSIPPVRHRIIEQDSESTGAIYECRGRWLLEDSNTGQPVHGKPIVQVVAKGRESENQIRVSMAVEGNNVRSPRELWLNFAGGKDQAMSFAINLLPMAFQLLDSCFTVQ